MREDPETSSGAGVFGWDGDERRSGRDRREMHEDVHENDLVYSKRRKADRRQAQFCYVCGSSFEPSPAQGRTCSPCQVTAMHMGNNARGWGAI